MHLVEELSPEMMLIPETAPFPLLGTYLKRFLSYRKVQIRVRLRHWTVYTVANTIYIEPEGNMAANELAKNVLSVAVYSPSTRVDTDNSPTMVEEKTAHNVFMRLKKVDDKFPGDFG